MGFASYNSLRFSRSLPLKNQDTKIPLLWENLVDICNETAAETKFISLVLEVLKSTGMGREVVLPEGTGGVNLPPEF